MLQGSNMTRGHRGMRKGISLVEMLIAILLFGIVATIGYTYYKNFFDVRDASRKARVYAIVDQAAQLASAYDLYVIKTGSVPADINALIQDDIITQKPSVWASMSFEGWKLESNVTFESLTTGEPAFVLNLLADVENNETELIYCNILNEIAYPDWNTSTPANDINTSLEFYKAGKDTDENSSDGDLEYFHCGTADWTGGTVDDNNFSFIFRIVENK